MVAFILAIHSIRRTAIVGDGMITIDGNADGIRGFSNKIQTGNNGEIRLEPKDSTLRSGLIWAMPKVQLTN
jgi:hypothetical protein